MAGAVYWVGADGNVWLKGDASVNGGATTNVGAANGTGATSAGANYGLQNGGFESNTVGQSIQANRIDDPNAPVQTAPASPNGASSSSSAPAYADKSNDIALQLGGLGAADSQNTAGLSSIDAALNQLLGQYTTEANTAQTSYKSNSDQNENNLQSNKEQALVNAAQGRQGLFGTLASLGALNGSGLTLANQAVQRGANSDLSGASDNFKTNQQGLDTAIGTFDQENKERRDEATTEAANDKTNVENNTAKNKQTFLSNLAGDYTAEGNAPEAANYSSQATALYPQIAATSVPSSTLTPTSLSFTAPSLSSYLGSNNTAVTSTDTTNGVPNLVAASLKKKTTSA